jgi:predicted lipoprotein with Yx(FWY)xxD motif
MSNKMARSMLLLTSALLFGTGAQAAGMLTAKNGMTLYTFDKDKGAVSSCYDACAAKWPPYIGKADEKMTKGWTLIKRTDGTMQWAYDKKPVYFFKSDVKKGDKAGDGMGGVWHVIKE